MFLNLTSIFVELIGAIIQPFAKKTLVKISFCDMTKESPVVMAAMLPDRIISREIQVFILYIVLVGIRWISEPGWALAMANLQT